MSLGLTGTHWDAGVCSGCRGRCSEPSDPGTPGKRQAHSPQLFRLSGEPRSHVHCNGRAQSLSRQPAPRSPTRQTRERAQRRVCRVSCAGDRWDSSTRDIRAMCWATAASRDSPPDTPGGSGSREHLGKPEAAFLRVPVDPTCRPSGLSENQLPGQPGGDTPTRAQRCVQGMRGEGP